MKIEFSLNEFRDLYKAGLPSEATVDEEKMKLFHQKIWAIVNGAADYDWEEWQRNALAAIVEAEVVPPELEFLQRLIRLQFPLEFPASEREEAICFLHEAFGFVTYAFNSRFGTNLEVCDLVAEFLRRSEECASDLSVCQDDYVQELSEMG
jgi:hypothetical protein